MVGITRQEPPKQRTPWGPHTTTTEGSARGGLPQPRATPSQQSRLLPARRAATLCRPPTNRGSKDTQCSPSPSCPLRTTYSSQTQSLQQPEHGHCPSTARPRLPASPRCSRCCRSPGSPSDWPRPALREKGQGTCAWPHAQRQQVPLHRDLQPSCWATTGPTASCTVSFPHGLRVRSDSPAGGGQGPADPRGRALGCCCTPGEAGEAHCDHPSSEGHVHSCQWCGLPLARPRTSHLPATAHSGPRGGDRP